MIQVRENLARRTRPAPTLVEPLDPLANLNVPSLLNFVGRWRFVRSQHAMRQGEPLILRQLAGCFEKLVNLAHGWNVSEKLHAVTCVLGLMERYKRGRAMHAAFAHADDKNFVLVHKND